ncbi:MAG: hypothetical protein ABSF76_02965 [Opitutaceae bacterium]|jgi:hypothetical protein
MPGRRSEPAEDSKRSCQPELLDSLAPDHPDAIHSRRDLRIVNRFMRNMPWFERVLSGLVRPDERVLELGAGTGELGRRLHKRALAADGLDLWPRPDGWPGDRAWHQADLRMFGGYGAYPVVIGNLIFHQFTDGELAALGGVLRRSARVVAASEPLRRKLSRTMMAAVAPYLGANHVTLHDADVSIRAGFLGEELPVLLGMNDGHWDYACTLTPLGAYRMVATRRP